MRKWIRPGRARAMGGLVAVAASLAVVAPAAASTPPPVSSDTTAAAAAPPTTDDSPAPTTTEAGPSGTTSTDVPTSTASAPVTTSTTGPATTSPASPSTSTSTSTTVAPPAPEAAERAVAALLLQGQLGLIKGASVGEVSPGESFNYTFTASCSGLEESCLNAQLVDTIPADLVITAPPASNDQYTVSVTGNTITITFTIPLLSPPNPPGSVGLPDGSALNLVVGVSLPAESQVADGVTLSNSATLTADGSAPVTDVANVLVDVPVVVTPVATKAWADGTAVAGTDEASTITLGV